MPKEKIYGVADRAWQPVIGCSPQMPCAPRCWARRTVERVVRCQEGGNAERANFFQIALTPDLQQWSGAVYLDPAHLKDPLSWKKPAVIATGFHGDWARLPPGEKDYVAAVMALTPQHRYFTLTKQPEQLAAWMHRLKQMADEWAPRTKSGTFSPADVLNFRWMHETMGHGPAFPYHEWPLPNVSIGVSVMNQHEADRVRVYMRAIAEHGWATHVWHEPALGRVDWSGWEFLRGMITGGESGPESRPMYPEWARADRDWCAAQGVPFFFKQWGDWAPEPMAQLARAGGKFDPPQSSIRVGKKLAGRLLDGRTHDAIPEVG